MLYCKKIVISFIIIFFLFSNTLVFGTDAKFVWSTNVEEASSVSVDTANTSAEDATGNFLNLESGGAVLMDQSTGKVLYEHNSHEKLRPASVTKVMSILLIMEALDSGRITLEDKVPCSETASSMGGSQIWLDTTETLSVHEMLKAICVVSANDCTVAMAEFLARQSRCFCIANEFKS